jgi:2-dehydropantoate 2-reductase
VSTIGIIGGGAIGSWHAARLARTGHDVRLFTRGAHLDAVKAQGIRVQSASGDFVAHPTATDDPGALEGTDWLLVAVKTYSLDDVADVTVRAARTGGIVMPLLNGVDAADRLAGHGVPRANLLGGLAEVSVARTAPGVVEHRSPFDRVRTGAFAGSPRSLRDAAQRIVADLVAAGTEARTAPDIVHDLWRKFLLLVPISVACGLARQPIGSIAAIPEGRDLLARAIAEIVAVAHAYDVPITDDDAVTAHRSMLALPGAIKPSFLLDLESGGQTEVDALAGTVSRLGRGKGVPTPIHDVATAAFLAASAGVRK